MSNGLGAGFAGLTLLAVLLGLAALLTVSVVGVFVFRWRTGTVPSVLRYLSSAMLAGVISITGFAVLALYDEAAILAALFVAIVLLPLAAVGVYLHQIPELTRLDTVATAGMAWSLPFVVGLVVIFGLTTGVNSVFDLAPAEAQQLGVYWLAMAVGGIAVMVGAILLGKHISKSLAAAPPS